MSSRLFQSLFLFFLLGISASAYFCPRYCKCSEHWMWSRAVFVVESTVLNLTKVPDLSGLITEDKPVYVDLENAGLKRITKLDFPPGLGITFMKLSRNSELEIEHDAFKGLRDTLIYLNLDSTDIPFNATLKFLQGLSKLETLSLSYNNNIRYRPVAPVVDVSLFGGLGLTSLKKLKMYMCRIEAMSNRAFRGVESMEELDLGANPLKEVPVSLGALRNLKILDLSNSRFVSIKSGVFLRNTKLKTLWISNSKLKELESGSFDGLQTSLEKLVIGNSLESVPSAGLAKLRALKVLKLDGNPMSPVTPGAFAGKYCLEELSLNSMMFDLTAEMFEGQERCIKSLVLQKRSLTRVPRQALKNLQTLNHLFLNQNEIEELTNGSFDGVKAKLIVLDGNYLRAINEGAFTGAAKSIILEISDTNVNDLSFILEYPEGTFESVNVGSSGVPCDCKTARVISFLPKKSLKGTCNVDDGAMDLASDDLYEYLTKQCPVEMSVASGLILYTFKLISYLSKLLANILP